jgi:2-keto-4-pentenoate hydratase/2-oxohepta-3-ene-1,7-dioic acid hydratase in catechol pathway
MEAEIAVVIGRRLYRADERDVWSAVAGVTAGNDLTARDVMKQTGVPALAKSFPGCTPLGASVRAVADVPDLDAIGVRGWVNGALRQDDTSADMLWSIPELLARISWFAALEPGDVFLSGTPSGTGQDRGDYLRPGDEVTVEVDGVLPLRTTVVAAAVSDPPSSGARTVPVP